MKKNRTAVTGLLLFMTVVLLGSTIYISTLLSSPDNSPTQIQKSKAAPITYKKTIDLAQFDATAPTPNVSVSPMPSISTTPIPTLLAKAALPSPTSKPSVIPTKSVTPIPTLLAKAPTLPPPTAVPTKVAIVAEPTDIPEIITPTLQPLLAYKSTSVTPTLIPIKDGTGGMVNPTIAAKSTPSPTKKIAAPTGVQTLPETGWVQTSSILFIVATTTILFSLLF
jgi:hypothetical protein